MALSCICGTELEALADLAFYVDLSGGYSLGLKNFDTQKDYKFKRLVCNKKKFSTHKLICNSCGAQIGRVVKNSGFPDFLTLFAYDKTYLPSNKSFSLSKVQPKKWIHQAALHKNIECLMPIQNLKSIPEGPPTVFFQPSDFDRMYKFGKPCLETPHMRQWLSYMFACLNDTVLYMQTGMGKTLVACMTIQAFKLLNPGKGAYFLVPKVVLVEQQANYIARATNLQPLKCSSQHSNSLWQPEDVVTCTPDTLLNNLASGRMSISQASIVVFDEAHEARGASPYEKILTYIFESPQALKPRILGLSATPLVGNAADSDGKAIKDFLEKFKSKIYAPSLDKRLSLLNEEKIVNKMIVDISPSSPEKFFKKFLEGCINHLIRSYEPISRELPGNCRPSDQLPLASGVVRGVIERSYFSNDNTMYLMANYIKKWIDCVDLLHVCGSKDLLLNIKSEFDNVDGSNDELLPHISSFRNFLKDNINILLTDLSQERSTAFSKLLACLRNFCSKNENGKIIVFVTRRKTAERICTKLCAEKDIKEKLAPTFILGTSNAAFSKERQQNALKSFHSGHCNLLVATSVLEQGIDVESCSLVICFDGVRSLTCLVQSRGRARNPKAQFVIFSSDQKETDRIIHEEKYLDAHISIIMDKQNADHINESQDLPQLVNLRQQAAVDSGNISFGDKSLTLMLGKGKVDTMKINMVDVAEKMSISYRASIEKKVAVFKFSCINYEECLHKILSNINFKSWVSIVQPQTHTPNFRGDFQSLGTFHHNDEYSITIEDPLIWSTPYELHLNESVLRIINKEESFHIDISDIDDDIIIHSSPTNGVSVFITLKQPPQFMMDHNKAPFDFNSRSHHLILKSTYMDAARSWEFRSALRHLGKVYDVPAIQMKNALPFSKPFENVDFEKEFLIKAWRCEHTHILPPNISQSILRSLYSLSKFHLKVTLDLFIPERYKPLKMPVIDLPENFALPEPIEGFVEMGRAKITPYRTIFMKKIPIQLNRILRTFGNSNDFLLVTISDEHDGNPWTTNTKNHLNSILYDGIRIGNKLFRFLGCSNSQLREGHCWLTCLDVPYIHQEIGTFPSGIKPERKLTRLALAFAASIITIKIPQKVLDSVEADIIENGVCFSEGIGRISKAFGKKLMSCLNLTNYVSAFQIRVGGIKGVVCVSDQTEDIIFRKSMKKFLTHNHCTVEVLNYSRSLRLQLNRQSILCLNALGVPNEVFLSLMKRDLKSCLDFIRNESEAIQFLQSQNSIFDWEKYPPEIIYTDPLFKKLLHRCALQKVRNIVDHAQISVPGGRVLMGVLDETRTLQYGQVYVRLIEDGVDLEIEGLVAVFRNPVVFDSDVRILKAVKEVSPRIRDCYVNTIVFPSTGPNSHAAECAGGDLDGDLFSVIWDPKLIPQEVEVPGHPVPSFEQEDCSKNIPPIEGEELRAMVNFFCNYVAESRLGSISNAHLVLADQKGIAHSDCVDMGKRVVAETDAPRLGLTVKYIPKELIPKKFPDFMQKHDKITYQSTSVLGIMYRNSIQLLNALIETQSGEIPSPVQINCPGRIEEFYYQYVVEIRNYLKSFQLETEEDFFSGSPLWQKTYMSKYKEEEQLKRVVTQHCEKFWYQWTQLYNNWKSELNDNVRSSAISDWYNFPKRAGIRHPAYSFSWLALPDHAHIEYREPTLEEKLTESLGKWVNFSKIDWLNHLVRRHEAVKKSNSILFGLKCNLYGSSLMGFSEDDYSDIDLCIGTEEKDLDSAYEMLQNKKISCSRHLSRPSRVEFVVNEFRFEGTIFQNGVRKSTTVCNYLDQHSSMWICLRALIQWARTVGILKSQSSQGLMPLIFFVWVYIYHVKRNASNMPHNEEPSVNDISRWARWVTAPRSEKWGQDLINFLKFLCDPTQADWIASLVDPVTEEVLLPKELIPEVAAKAQLAEFQLTLYNGSIEKLFSIISKSKLFKIPPWMSSDDHTLQQQLIRDLKDATDPEDELFIRILTKNDGRRVQYLEVSGKTQLFEAVEKTLRLMFNSIHRVRNAAHHVAGSTIILIEQASLNCHIKFQDLKKEFHLHHTGFIKRQIRAVEEKPNLMWKENGKKKFIQLFTEQLLSHDRLLCTRQTSHHRFFGKMFCSIRIGNHYLFNVPSIMDNTFDIIKLYQVEEAIRIQEETFILEEKALIESFDEKSEDETHRKTDTPVIELISLSDINKRGIVNKCFALPKESRNNIRHTFYPLWRFGIDSAFKFTSNNGFSEIHDREIGLHFSVTVYWRGVEAQINLTDKGGIKQINYRSVRWVSTTLKCQGKGEDIRIYLESRAPLQDESLLKRIVEMYSDRSILTQPIGPVLSNTPLVSDFFDFDWKVFSMRRIQKVKSFMNSSGIFLTLYEIQSGQFDTESHKFYQDQDQNNIKRYEFEASKDVCGTEYEELGSELFDTAISLFDYINQQLV